MPSSKTTPTEELALDTGKSESPTITPIPGAGDSGPVTLNHVVDFYHRYPGEIVTFYTCVGVQEPVSDMTLRIQIPAGLELVGHHCPPELATTSPTLHTDDQAHYLVWPVALGREGQLEPGARFEYQTQARVAPVTQNTVLESQASLIDTANHRVLAEESVSLALWAQGRYLRYLPELYEQDELMGRLLMLFESFWAPIESQIGAMPYYLEPKTTPRQFMPWLAGWLGLELDVRLGEDRQRELISSAIWLHRRRGTKQALQEYLQLYTGGQVQITEHRAIDFCLGAEGRLGGGVALGIGNHPHTFAVHLTLPASLPPGETNEDSQGESRVRRMIEAIIEAEKPAHTGYTLIVEGIA